MSNEQTMRDVYFSELFEIAKLDRRIILVAADMGAPALDKWRRELPQQFVNVGIAEQNAILISAGLAMSGKLPYAYAIMPFITLRCYEMLKVEGSLMDLPITIVGVGAGFGYDDSGPTHHSTEDIAVMRALPGWHIFNPADNVAAGKMAGMELGAPTYIRLDRKPLPAIHDEKMFNARVGMTQLCKGDGHLTIMATGNMVHTALKVAEKLHKRGSHWVVGVTDFSRLKPVDTYALGNILGNNERVVTLEEHLLNGGLGSIVLEAMADMGIQKPILRLGIPDKYYYAYGGRENIQKQCGLDEDSVVKRIQEWVGA